VAEHASAPATRRGRAGETLIRFVGVKKAFGAKVIYSGLNLEITRGETITVMGPSGSGKSVMLKMLIGLIHADAGEILFDGQDLVKASDEQLTEVRRRIAYLFQGAALFDSLNVAENVAYGLREQFWNTMSNDEIMSRVEQSLELVGLPGIGDMRPSDLSGGMKKRVGLARALAPGPEIILYDEPTTGLDPTNTRRINELITSLQEKLGVTSIVITHDISSALAVCDRVALVRARKIALVVDEQEAESSPPAELAQFMQGEEVDEQQGA
jgi:phospholipid/cholesterol/gamma-HCH transport system ATP-binding protein